jgi:hypothetical protein
MPISFSMIVLSSHLVVAVADAVPKFDIARSPVVQIPGGKPGKLRLAREHWWDAKLRQSANMPPARSVG